MTIPPATSLHDPADSVYKHWQQLNQWLSAHQALWRAAPFTDPQPDWTVRYRDLAHYIEGLSDSDCKLFDEHPEQLAERVSKFLPSLGERQSLVTLPAMANQQEIVAVSTLPETRATDMPGRKRLQAGAFAAAVQPLAHPVLDWCCGKGHLARTLAAQCSAPVTGFEWNDALVMDGNRLVRRFNDDVTLHRQDVMAPDLTLSESIHGVALHACGDLHRRLIQRASEHSAARVSFSPCCYHLTATEDYQPMSDRAQGCGEALRLNRSELRLAVQETVTAPARVRAETARISGWRLGFDGLQRALRGMDGYLPVPSHPARLAGEDFETFCRWAADKRGVALPAGIDFHYWQRFGERRLSQVRRHDLVRHLFRRPLELWMVLDYVLYLEERGYAVRVGTFCDRQLTPRNILVDAVRACGSPPVRRNHP
ncbi:MAG: methyltransferase [Marinobacter sp.]